MTVHILKLCVGVSEITELAQWQAERAQRAQACNEPFVLQHVTRNTPRRKDDVLAGGSLYWVIKRLVQVRQRITAIEPVTREDGQPACALVLDPEIVQVEPRPHRAFQGWRYLEDADAPRDIGQSGLQGESLPPALMAELKELGLL